jgi:hypothetical protein
MRNEEHNIQVACVRWFRLQYRNRLIFAIPNGGARSIVTGAMLKAEGATKGVPDLLIPEPHGERHGLFVEMKTAKGAVKAEQKEMMRMLEERCYRCAVCRSFDDFRFVVADYFKDTN